MSDETEMIEALHPDPTKQGQRVNRAAYEAYRDALLEAIPDTADGIAFGELAAAVEVLVPNRIRTTTSPGWWTTTVKLDLEARGLIERIEGTSRQRVRRTTSP